MAKRGLSTEEILQLLEDIDEDNSEGEPLHSSDEEWQQLPKNSDLSSSDDENSINQVQDRPGKMFLFTIINIYIGFVPTQPRTSYELVPNYEQPMK